MKDEVLCSFCSFRVSCLVGESCQLVQLPCKLSMASSKIDESLKKFIEKFHGVRISSGLIASAHIDFVPPLRIACEHLLQFIDAIQAHRRFDALGVLECDVTAPLDILQAAMFILTDVKKTVEEKS